MRKINVEQLTERKTLDNLVYFWHHARPERALQIERELKERSQKYEKKYHETYIYSLARNNGRGLK